MYTRPRNFLSMTPSGPDNSLVNHRWLSANAIADLFFHQCRRTLSRFGVGCTSADHALELRFFSGWLRIEIARLTRVLNSVLIIVDGRSELIR